MLAVGSCMAARWGKRNTPRAQLIVATPRWTTAIEFPGGGCEVPGRRFSIEEREELSRGLVAKESLRSIAGRLGRSTVPLKYSHGQCRDQRLFVQ
jgi:hypothetical protein